MSTTHLPALQQSQQQLEPLERHVAAMLDTFLDSIENLSDEVTHSLAEKRELDTTYHRMTPMKTQC